MSWQGDDGAETSACRARHYGTQSASFERFPGGNTAYDQVEPVLGTSSGARDLDQPGDASVLGHSFSISDMSDLDTSSPPPRPKSRAKPRPKQPDWRRKHREEISRLRVEAAALSETLVALRAVACSRTLDADDASPRHLTGPPSAAALWRRLAVRQLASRTAAEQENERLRLLVEQRRKETRELRRGMLLKRANLQGIHEVLNAGWLSRVDGQQQAGSISDDDALVFHSLRGQVDALYAELDAVFSRSSADKLRCPDRTVQTKESEGGQIVWEFVDVHAVPFDRDATARALWRTFGEDSWLQQRGSEAQYVQVSTSECMARVRFRLSMPVLAISVLTRKVTKRFVERDRVVFVSNSLHQPFFNGELSSHVAVFCEVDRTVVYTTSARRSEIRRHIVATTGGDSMAQVATEGSDWRATDRYAAGVHAWNWAITRDNHMVEDALLREARQQS